MKKVVFHIILVISILLGIKNVSAKDVVYSNKKYKEANLVFIEKSYDNDHKIDGMVTAGTYLAEIEEEDSPEEIPSLLLIKYKKNGKVSWIYTQDEIKENQVIGLNYTYDEEEKIDGYLVTLEITQEEKKETVFLKIDLEGNLIWNRPSGLNRNEKIEKMIPIYTEDNEMNGYLSIASISEENLKKVALSIYYDKEMNILWTQEYQNGEMLEVSYTDIALLHENNTVIGCVLLRSQIDLTKNEIIDLIKIDSSGNESVLHSDIKKNESVSLQASSNGFLLYGITSEVKLKKGNNSYYLLNYDQEGNELWESIGEIAVSKEQEILLLPTENTEHYFLLYKNDTDSSYEVIELDQEGIFVKKVKKIQNDYYNFENFSFLENTLYFVGQIDCPEEDNCDYKDNSLFLISDEDKVIEVKDNALEKVIIGVAGIVFLAFITIIFQKKRLVKR